MKHSDYLKKKKTRETRKKIISVISAIVVFITTYALVLPAITLDVSKASQEPGIAYEQMQFRATAAAASVTAADSTEEEAQVEEPAAEEPEEEAAEEVKEEEPAETPEEEASAVSDEEEEPEEEAPAEPEQEEAPAEPEQEKEEAPEVREDESEADSADEKASGSAPSEAEAADTQKAAEDAAVDQTGTDAAEAAAAATTEEAAPEFKIPELDALDFDDILTGKTNFYYYHVENAEEAEELSSDSIDDWKKVGSDTVLAPEDFVRVYLSYEIPAGALNETNAVARYTLPAGLELSDKQIKAINKYENGIASSKSGSEKDKYLGAEAIEGSRTPDEKADDEYIAATVKVKKTDNDRQELVFTFIPYTVEKNQISYDEKGEVKSKGKEVKGFFTFDLKTSQIDFEKTSIETVEKEDGTTEEIQYSEAKAVFADEDSNWIERALTLVAPVEKEEPQEPKTLTKEGDDYTVTISYTDEAQIPDNAALKVEEIKKDTPEYTSYLDQAKGAVEDGTKSVNEARFFDITIVADGQEIEPKASVNVQINFKGIEQTNTDDAQLLHYKESDEVEVMDKAEFSKSEEAENSAQSVDTVQFETDGFSVYGIVGTETITVPFTASDGSTYEVSVDFDEDAGIPEGAQLKVAEVTEDNSRYDDYVKQAAGAIDSRVIDLNYVKLLDIEIVDESNNKVDLKAPVDVQIKLLDKEQAEDTTKVVHFEGANETPIVVDSSVEVDTVSFSADSFSVYAVVGEGDTSDYARMTVNFKNGDSNIATMYVKNNDTTEDLNTILYDPGMGDTTVPQGATFRGWIRDKKDYTIDDIGSAMNIEEIRQWAASQEISEGMDEVNFYAVFVKNINVTYLDENGISLGSHTFTLPYDTTSVDYTVNMAYTPDDPTKNFEGWNVKSGGSNINGYQQSQVYNNETDITITGDVVFSVNAPTGHWLVFDENGRGGTYNAPQFVKDGQVTQRPIPDSEMTRFGYTFGGWYTDAACTNGNEFTFGSTLTDNTTIYAKWISNETANYTILIWKQNLAGDDYDFAESVTLSGNVGSIINTVSQQGTGNSAYARITGRPDGQNVQYTGFHLKEFDQNVSIVTEGTSVLNVYYDRNTVTLNFYVYDQTSGYTSTTENDQYGAYYGRFSSYGYPSNSGGSYRRLYRLQNGGWGYPTDGTNNGQYYRYVDGGQYYVQYSGNRYTRNGSWRLYTTTSGRFETLLSENNFTWPTTYNWYEQQGAGGGAGGTRITFLDAYLPPNPNTSVYNMYGQAVVGDVQIRFYKQDADNPNNYVLANTVTATPGTFYITDKYHGFEAYRYRIDGGQWQSVGTKNSEGTYNNGEGVEYTTGLDIRFNRLKYPILYMDGVYVDGNNNPVAGYSSRGQLKEVRDVVYGSNVSSYNKGGANYYEPTYDGFVFDGWYIDDACTQPYTFTTMPEGITVYAKWRQIQYRVFLHPNAGTDPTLFWGSDTQQLTFRVSNGGKVSLPTGTRNEYELIGWFRDVACTQPYPASEVLNETTVSTPYDKTTDFTEGMDKWGNNATSNGDVDRPWINKKVDIYAKWRKILIGADGINVVYDANGGTNPPTDTNFYLDEADAIAQAASTAPNGKMFKHWVVQKWDEAQNKFVDTSVIKLPGETFTVYADDAHQVEKPESTVENPKYEYTVQLRAEYMDKGEEIPTYIHFYANNQDKNGNAIPDVTIGNSGNEPKDETTYHNNIKINEAVDILSIEHVLGESTLYSGYTFLGWAKSRTANEPWLKWNGTDYDIVQGQDQGVLEGVTQIAADEKQPYDNLYAVWEPKLYTVKVIKITEVDYTSDEFDFTPNFSATGVAGETNGFTLTGGTAEGETNMTTFVNVPYNSTFSITEVEQPYYNCDVKYSVINPDDSSKDKTDQATNNGTNLTVQGDMIVTFTNTRKQAEVTVNKIVVSDVTTDHSSTFTFTLMLDGTTGETFQLADNESKALMVPYGREFSIAETPNDNFTTEYAIGTGTKTTGAETNSMTIEDDTSVTFTNTRKTADVTIKKILENTFIKETSGVNFNFTANWGQTTPESVTINTVSDTNGKTINNVPVGVEMVITETEDDAYVYTVSAAGASTTDKDTTDNSYSFDVPANGETVTFTNTVELTSGVNVTKTDNQTPARGLKGAVFQFLRNNKLDGTGTYVEIAGTFGGSITSKENGVMITATDQLPTGFYKLKETTTPEGYIITNAEVEFQIVKDAEGNTMIVLKGTPPNASLSNDGKTLTIINETGAALPYTGGFGTLPYALCGVMLVCISALMYGFRMRRRERRLN